MDHKEYQAQKWVSLAIWGGLALVSFLIGIAFPKSLILPSGHNFFKLLGIACIIAGVSQLFSLITLKFLHFKNKPAIEAKMVSRLYTMLAVLGVIIFGAYGFGKLDSFTSFFTLFGGMLLGWSLQAPVSGFAAWILVSLKRPFRPGDRIQFPSLGLVGDVKEVGAMYTKLDQVGGAIGSEEAVGRYILVPNAMLFGQVVINYTVVQEAAYMLDEVVIRITYDSDWKIAEQILLNAATEVTKDIIEATKIQPYIRSDLYDYGVYLRLRYQTKVQERAEIAYRITRRIFEEFQKTSVVDMAIPYVYSYRAGLGRKEEDISHSKKEQEVIEIPIAHIHAPEMNIDSVDIQPLLDSITIQGLLQPIVVELSPQDGFYDIVAGHLRYEACKRLGWKTIPATIRSDEEINTKKTETLVSSK
jgi:small-conductance mechanosensitive channel